MNVEQIRALISKNSPDYRLVAAECDEAIKMGPLSSAAHAEVLCYFAEAMSHLDPVRTETCIRYAYRASYLAELTGKPLVIVRATCLGLRLMATRKGATEQELMAELNRLADRIDSGDLRLDRQQRAQANKFVAGAGTVIKFRTS